MARVRIRARAWRDLLENADYLEEQGGEELSLRFMDAAQETFEALAAMPRSGALCGFTKLANRRLRHWPVRGFENWLIFYKPIRDGVEIVHLMHGARDIQTLLDG